MIEILFKLLLITFPFGQLIKWQFINFFDVLVFLLTIFVIFKKPKYPEWFSYYLTFIYFCLFTWVFNYFVLKHEFVVNNLLIIKSMLYLIRIFCYSYLSVYVFNYPKINKHLTDKLIFVSVASAILGWIQYIFLPDVRFLKLFGWDDHLYRMVGTILDPAFLGLIFVLGVFLSLIKKKYISLIFLATSVIFTYSRASYLVLFLVFIFDLFKNKNIFKFLLLNLSFVLIFVAPKNLSEGTNFARTVSGLNKLENSAETISMFLKSPLLGVGFNNLCILKNPVNIKSHSCFGADNSILFILATTGVVGFLLFITFILKLPNSYLIMSSFAIVLIHSMFTNSLFYPHIMFWLFVILGSESYAKRS